MEQVEFFDVNTEWTLYSYIYAQIIKLYGPFQIDLFGSRLNAKDPVYVSWKPDPSAPFIDAFSRDWSEFSNFMPFLPLV